LHLNNYVKNEGIQKRLIFLESTCQELSSSMLGGAKSTELKKLKKWGVGFNPDPTGLASRLPEDKVGEITLFGGI
jgi:hypothetical protein